MVLFSRLWIHRSPGALRIWWLGLKRNYELMFAVTEGN